MTCMRVCVYVESNSLYINGRDDYSFFGEKLAKDILIPVTTSY